MAENNRNLSVFLLVLALIGAALFYGCGSATSDRIPDIEYSITGSYVLGTSSSNVNATSRAANVPGLQAGILIYSEAAPTNYADVDQEKNRYVIRNLKPGKHYIVFRHSDSMGGNYIVRSSQPVELTNTEPVKELNEQLKAVEGTIAITGKVTNIKKQLITPTPTISLWGQTIEVNPFTGEFTTPKMPEGTTADLIVNAINYKENPTPVVFETNPAYYDFSAVETTSTNVPPTVTVSSKRDTYNLRSTVTLTAVAQDANNDELEFKWYIESCTSPKVSTNDLEKVEEYLKGSDYTSIYYWNAPDEDCTATITVEVKEKYTNLSARAKLNLKIGTGNYHQNTIPTILSTSIYPETLYGNRTYTITSIATDTDGDALTYFLNITPISASASINLSKSSVNTWTWRTASESKAISYKLDFEVRDPKGNTNSLTRTVNVRASEPNNPPIIENQDPVGTIEVRSGTEQTLTLVAKDPENEKVTFAWTSKKGSLLRTYVNGNMASATWRAPYLNNPTETYINCTIRDPYNLSVSATFTINIIPDPNKKAPEITIDVVASSSPNVNAPSGVPLLKPNESITFTGSAMDLNKGVSIDPSHFKWEIKGPNDDNFVPLNNASNTAIFNVTAGSPVGDYIVKMISTDLAGEITGEGTKEFRVNATPLADILCNGNELVNGRMSPTTTYKYDNGSEVLDVFTYSTSEKISFTASCTDLETDLSTLQNNSNWTLNGNKKPTVPLFECPLTATGTNIVTLKVSDSKEVYSATSTYKFFVNTAPTFDIATSTKISYVPTEKVEVYVKAKDDVSAPGIQWYVANNPSFSLPVPVTDSIASCSNEVVTNTITSKLDADAEYLMNTIGSDLYFRAIATDTMGLTTESNIIHTYITEPHEIARFIVASGAYYNNQPPFSFGDLEKLLLPSDSEYENTILTFEADQKFSMSGGSSKATDTMIWKWEDSLWEKQADNTYAPGKFNSISAGLQDSFMGYILNGYSITGATNFGTHTIRLTGENAENGIVASNSIIIFINSTPKIEFINASSDTIRFDTNSDATFTITLKEDDPNEKIGLKWTITELKDDCEPDETKEPIIFTSHSEKSEEGKPPVYMAGAKEKTVIVKWSEITKDNPTPLSEGAKRVEVCATDQYGKAATATVDVLVNTLPAFNVVVEGTDRKVKIMVPQESDNDTENEGYAEFYKQQQYTTVGTDTPVFLVTYSSMLLDFTVIATDTEDGILDGASITWKYTDYSGSTITKTGANITGRFNIGANTVNVECHDKNYGRYSKNGDNTVYNHMCVATYSADFYVWNSTSYNLENCKSAEDGKTGTVLYNRENSGLFYVQFGTDTPYIESWQLDQNETVNLEYIVPGIIPAYILGKDSTEGETKNKVVATETPDILAVLQSDKNHFMLIANTLHKRVSVMPTADPLIDADYVEYTGANEELDKPQQEWIATFTVVDITSSDKPTENKRYLSFNSDRGNYDDLTDTFDTCGYPGLDIYYPQKILSMTYSNESENSAGAMLLYGWNGYNGGAIAAYNNKRIKVVGEEIVAPLYNLDSQVLNISPYSKLRYLSKLDLSEKLFITDTNNNRLIKINSGFGKPTSIVATLPIDVCTTNKDYMFSLSESGAAEVDDAITLYAVNNTSATPLTSFAKFTDATNYYERAGKVKNPKSIMYYVTGRGKDYYGGLMILEEGHNGCPNRIQVIRSNKENWLE